MPARRQRNASKALYGTLSRSSRGLGGRQIAESNPWQVWPALMRRKPVYLTNTGNSGYLQVHSRPLPSFCVLRQAELFDGPGPGAQRVGWLRASEVVSSLEPLKPFSARGRVRKTVGLEGWAPVKDARGERVLAPMEELRDERNLLLNVPLDERLDWRILPAEWEEVSKAKGVADDVTRAHLARTKGVSDDEDAPVAVKSFWNKRLVHHATLMLILASGVQHRIEFPQDPTLPATVAIQLEDHMERLESRSEAAAAVAQSECSRRRGLLAGHGGGGGGHDDTGTRSELEPGPGPWPGPRQGPGAGAGRPATAEERAQRRRLGLRLGGVRAQLQQLEANSDGCQRPPSSKPLEPSSSSLLPRSAAAVAAAAAADINRASPRVGRPRQPQLLPAQAGVGREDEEGVLRGCLRTLRSEPDKVRSPAAHLSVFQVGVTMVRSER
jgi:hypothetical protein